MIGNDLDGTYCYSRRHRHIVTFAYTGEYSAIEEMENCVDWRRGEVFTHWDMVTSSSVSPYNKLNLFLIDEGLFYDF